MRNAIRYAAIVMAAIIAVGCQGGGVLRESEPPALHELRLKQALSIPAGAARTYFQQGRQQAGKNRYEPHCEFELSTVSDRPQSVRADVFKVRRLTQRLVADEHSGMPPALNLMRNQDVFYETQVLLQSLKQPAVRKLICRHWTQSYGRLDYLSGAQIQAILGEIWVVN
jgi:hypothetical protein